MRRILIVVAACFLWASCSGPSKNPDGATRVFPLNAFFDAQADSLRDAHAPLRKTIRTNGRQETIMEQNPDWKTELRPFASSGIDKPALAAGYDSTRSGDWLIYHAKDLHPAVQRIGIRFAGNAPDSVYIFRRVSNFYYTALDTLQYHTSGRYRISTMNKPVIGKEIRFLLEGIAE
jgi:hypothetical protein